MSEKKFLFLFLIISISALSRGESQRKRVAKVSSKFLESLTGNFTFKTDQWKLDLLSENISKFLESVHSGRHALLQKYEEASLEDEKCLRDIQSWLADTKDHQLYALQMQDSWATRQGGMLEGNVRWVGHYYECINSVGNNFRGKYCTTYYGFDYQPHVRGIPYDITFDSCFPDSCSEQVVNNLTGQSTANDIISPVLETICSTQNKSYGGFEISIIIVSVIFLAMSCIGTLYDGLLQKVYFQSGGHWLMCFSVLKNGKKILSTKQPPNNIRAINGIRTISTLWVILGHTASSVVANFDNVITIGNEMRKRFELLVIVNGTFSVDTFFCIAGLLTSYLTLKSLRKTKGKMNIPFMYLHRYLRLTPLYAYVLLFTVGVYKFLGSGPRWNEMFEYDKHKCDELWWTNLLYINNLYPVTNYCFGHSWYLACDMQFYILSPFFVYFIYRWPKIGITSVLSILAASIGVTWWLSQSSNQQPLAVFQAEFYTILSRYFSVVIYGQEKTFQERFRSDLYFTPWCRIGAYMIGVLSGSFLHYRHTVKKTKFSKVVVLTGWIVSAVTAVSLVYGVYGATKEPHPMDVKVAAFYNAVSRPLWTVCIAWVIVACTCGYGGPVTKILDFSLFLPLSRLTYAAYLVHYFVIHWFVAIQEQYLHYSSIWLTYSYSGHVVISFCLAFIVAIFIEWPCQEALKILLPVSGRATSSKEAVREDIKKNSDRKNFTSHGVNCKNLSRGKNSFDMLEAKQKRGVCNTFYSDNENIYVTKI